MAKESQKHLSNKYRKHGVIDKGKYKKTSRKKLTDREYHVQVNADVANK